MIDGMGRSTLITHAVVLITLIISYTVITVTGHDGTALLGAIAGYIGAAGVSQVTTTTTPPPPSGGS